MKRALQYRPLTPINVLRTERRRMTGLIVLEVLLLAALIGGMTMCATSPHPEVAEQVGGQR